MTVHHAHLEAQKIVAPLSLRLGAIALGAAFVGVFLFQAAQIAAGIVA